MASHFGASGGPNGFTTREEFFTAMAIVGGGSRGSGWRRAHCSASCDSMVKREVDLASPTAKTPGTLEASGDVPLPVSTNPF
jgi:hypothetical protein